MRLSWFAERQNMPTDEVVEWANEQEEQHEQTKLSRRHFLATSAKVAALGAISTAGIGCGEPSLSEQRSWLSVKSNPGHVAIVGAGLAGLSCADELKRYGIQATLYDAANRVGGRCFSLSQVFPGQVAERGGEYIDTAHKTMLGWAREFGLALEDVNKEPGEVTYFLDGVPIPESKVVDEFRALVPAMKADLRTLSGEPTAASHTAADVKLDLLNLREYLKTRHAGPIITKVIDVAYAGEYGKAIEEQSCLNFLLFIHADRRGKFHPFGVFSDERYHVVAGNDLISQGLASRLPGQFRFDHRLLAMSRRADNSLTLTFQAGSKTVTAHHDTVVLAIPFSVLRGVQLNANLNLPDWKLRVIQNFGYGTNAKMMVGFNARPWREAGSNGSVYTTGLQNFQQCWETNPTAGTNQRGILTDYSAAERGARLNPNKVQAETAAFLTDLDRIFPGALAKAARDKKGNFLSVLQHWPSNPLTLGSYTCNQPGYFTTMAGLENVPVGNVFFAGEHTNSFYEWQGFLEGAALSGTLAAKQVVGRA